MIVIFVLIVIILCYSNVNTRTITTTDNNNDVINANDLISFQNFLLLGKVEDKIKSATKFEEMLRDIDNKHPYSNLLDGNEYKLSSEQIQFYKLYGFLIVKDVFNSDTIISYLSTIWISIRTQTNRCTNTYAVTCTNTYTNTNIIVKLLEVPLLLIQIHGSKVKS